MHAVCRARSHCLVSLIAFLLLLTSALSSNAQSMSALWSQGNLSLTIPYHADRAGAGKLEVELLGPDDQVLARADRQADAFAGNGVWKQDLTIRPSTPFDQLVWQRLRYRFQYNGDTTPAVEQTRSVSAILRRPVMHILGQTSYLAGAPAAVRVIVSDASHSGTGESPIAGNGTVRVQLLVPKENPRLLFSGHLDSHGTTQAQFRFPSRLRGSYSLHFVADTPIGSAETTENVRVEDKVSILLTTEKPLYQPSQTIHARALALDRSDRHAAAGRKLTFEIEDSRGNKVFRKSATTDAFGIASAEFTLADEVNLGAYHLRALMGDAENPESTAEVTLNVQRYVLPKFRVAIDFAAKDGKPKRDYRPGDHITGTVLEITTSRSQVFAARPPAIDLGDRPADQDFLAVGGER